MALSDLVAQFFGSVLRGLFEAMVEALFMAPLRAMGLIATKPAFREAGPEAIRPLRHRVLREGRPLEDAIWPGDDEARHFLLEWAGSVVAVATIMQNAFPDGDGPSLQLRGMAVGPEHQGKGLGAQLVTGIQEAVGEPMWCNARMSALPFYEKQGWTAVGETFEVQGIGPHRRMISR
ncbi:MAG: GNAT family N-acetyltransferase [Proteobacteria bacterium]|nr:GNAT family N-acetyltransferase [Pseudomonadota bacterium]